MATDPVCKFPLSDYNSIFEGFRALCLPILCIVPTTKNAFTSSGFCCSHSGKRCVEKVRTFRIPVHEKTYCPGRSRRQRNSRYFRCTETTQCLFRMMAYSWDSSFKSLGGKLRAPILSSIRGRNVTYVRGKRLPDSSQDFSLTSLQSPSEMTTERFNVRYCGMPSWTTTSRSSNDTCISIQQTLEGMRGSGIKTCSNAGWFLFRSSPG